MHPDLIFQKKVDCTRKCKTNKYRTEIIPETNPIYNTSVITKKEHE